MTDKQFKELVGVLQLVKNKEGYYFTTWGKKNDQGLKATIEAILEKEEDCDLCYEGNCPHSCHAKHMGA